MNTCAGHVSAEPRHRCTHPHDGAAAGVVPPAASGARGSVPSAHCGSASWTAGVDCGVGLRSTLTLISIVSLHYDCILHHDPTIRNQTCPNNRPVSSAAHGMSGHMQSCDIQSGQDRVLVTSRNTSSLRLDVLLWIPYFLQSVSHDLARMQAAHAIVGAFASLGPLMAAYTDPSRFARQPRLRMSRPLLAALSLKYLWLPLMSTEMPA